MGTLNVPPARVAIGTVSNAAGQVLMTVEFSRFLSDFLARVGGPGGASNTELAQMIKSQDVKVSDLVEAIAALQGLIGTIPNLQQSVDQALAQLALLPGLLAQSGVAHALTGTTAETSLATIVIPGGKMGKNGMLRITTSWSMTNNERNKTVSIKFSGSVISSTPITTSSTYQEQRTIQNRNSLSSQVFVFGGGAYTGAPIGTMTKDTSTDRNVDIVAQLESSADTMTLESYTVELLPFGS